ncbi:MAG TPA: hypothetical protein VMV26_01130 [Alphaproteobacteria bacterium]|jgi:hypothetical protein|nr:hypothetical protein [Alphaproteobacteria bacterium]
MSARHVARDDTTRLRIITGLFSTRKESQAKSLPPFPASRNDYHEKPTCDTLA